jgi:hypothetical protein
VSGRGIFVGVSATVLAVLLFVAVVRPAIDRGGAGELVGVAALFLVILIAERWLRSR